MYFLSGSYLDRSMYFNPNIKDSNKKTKRKVKKPSETNKTSYDEYGDRKNQKIDYEKDRPPHW